MNKKFAVLLGVGVVAAALVLAVVLGREQVKPTYSETTVVFQKTGQVISVWVPTNEAASMKGLGDRTVIPEDYGMLWRYTPPQLPHFTMRGMQFPLDFIWIRNGEVVGATENVQPGTTEEITIGAPVTEVLEMRAGSARNLELVAGDKVKISDWSE